MKKIIVGILGLASIGAAVYLNINNSVNWGWFLFIGLCCIGIIYEDEN